MKESVQVKWEMNVSDTETYEDDGRKEIVKSKSFFSQGSGAHECAVEYRNIIYRSRGLN